MKTSFPLIMSILFIASSNTGSDGSYFGWYADLQPLLSEMRAKGLTLQAMATGLNGQGHTTRRGKPWIPVQVRTCTGPLRELFVGNAMMVGFTTLGKHKHALRDNYQDSNYCKDAGRAPLQKSTVAMHRTDSPRRMERD